MDPQFLCTIHMDRSPDVGAGIHSFQPWVSFVDIITAYKGATSYSKADNFF